MGFGPLRPLSPIGTEVNIIMALVATGHKEGFVGQKESGSPCFVVEVCCWTIAAINLTYLMP